MECQKTKPMRFAVFQKMWVIVIWDTHYMATKKTVPGIRFVNHNKTLLE